MRYNRQVVHFWESIAVQLLRRRRRRLLDGEPVLQPERKWAAAAVAVRWWCVCVCGPFLPCLCGLVSLLVLLREPSSEPSSDGGFFDSGGFFNSLWLEFLHQVEDLGQVVLTEPDIEDVRGTRIEGRFRILDLWWPGMGAVLARGELQDEGP